MDAEFKEKRRERFSSLREKRWSMNSQRLEEIVAELMRPIGDLRHSFDTDLSALLEEYLTEAGLRALDAEDSDAEDSGSGVGVGAEAGVIPNFAELALLLQQSANIYGRKVDCLYQHVLSVSDSLQSSTIEIANTSTEQESETLTPSTSRRKRKASTSMDFSYIELESSESSRREPGAARPPPTLPRMYIELEPRVLGEGEAPLLDYDNEPIGLLTDFHVAWRIQNGLLVEELAGCSEPAALRPIPLMELQAAIEANAPPSPPPLPPSPPPPALDDTLEPDASSTPLPSEREPFPRSEMPPPPPPPPPKRDRKRKSEVAPLDVDEPTVKLHVSPQLRRYTRRAVEFSVPGEWVRRVVGARSRALLLLRRRLKADPDLLQPLHGFEYCLEATGFLGWTVSEALAASEAVRSARRDRLDDSDDDGFFEQSDLGDSDQSRAGDTTPRTLADTPTEAERLRLERSAAEAAEWAAWRARQAQRAALAEGRAPLDVHLLAGAVLQQLPAGGEAAPFAHLLRRSATQPTDVSRVFLATLFLANSGNVEICPGAPLSLNSFSVRLLSTDERLYAAAAAADPVNTAPAPAPAPAPTEPPAR